MLAERRAHIISFDKKSQEVGVLSLESQKWDPRLLFGFNRIVAFVEPNTIVISCPHIYANNLYLSAEKPAIAGKNLDTFENYEEFMKTLNESANDILFFFAN